MLQEPILAYNEAITTDEVKTYITLNNSKDFLREILDIEMFVMYNVQTEQFTLEPSIEYDLNDLTGRNRGANATSEA